MSEDLMLKLQSRYLDDLRKKDIDEYERAEIIQSMMKKERLSIRGFCKQYGFNRSAVQDWLRYAKVSKKDRMEMNKKGISNNIIYNGMRKGIEPTKLPEYAKIVTDDVLNFMNEINQLNSKSHDILNRVKKDKKLLSEQDVYVLNSCANNLRKIAMYIKQ
jgi:hypothetical protein